MDPPTLRPIAPSGYVRPKYALGDSMVETLRKEMMAWRAERARRTAVGEVEVATGLSSAPDGRAAGIEPLRWRARAATEAVPRLRTLPVSPYPAAIGTRVGMRVYGDPMGRIKGAARWTFGHVIEYKSPHGKVAEPGSYDDLAKMTLSSIPEGGCSGGPIVDVNSGAVVGIVRGEYNTDPLACHSTLPLTSFPFCPFPGSTHSYGDRQQRGFATPAEKVFEVRPAPSPLPAPCSMSDYLLDRTWWPLPVVCTRRLRACFGHGCRRRRQSGGRSSGFRGGGTQEHWRGQRMKAGWQLCT